MALLSKVHHHTMDLNRATVKMAEIIEIAVSGWVAMSRQSPSLGFLYFKIITRDCFNVLALSLG